MTEGHPSEDQLVELALDELPRSERNEVLGHLDGCERCRSDYDGYAAVIDRTLAAAPRVEPPAGFDGAVLAALGGEDGVHEVDVHGGVDVRGGRPRARRAVGLVAAALIGIAVGAGATAAITSGGDADPPADRLTANGAFLRTADGRTVGTAVMSTVDGEPVVVIGVSEAAAGANYQCRLLLADGRRVVAGSWDVGYGSGWTWVVRAPSGRLAGVELVTSAGTVWSVARFTA